MEIICPFDRASFKIIAGIFHGHFTTKITIDPFNGGISMSNGPFGYQIVDIVRPILNGGISNMRIIMGNQLNNGTMQ